jgi:hypothetical protein
LEVLDSSFGKTRDEIKYQDESSIEDLKTGDQTGFSHQQEFHHQFRILPLTYMPSLLALYSSLNQKSCENKILQIFVNINDNPVSLTSTPKFCTLKLGMKQQLQGQN